MKILQLTSHFSPNVGGVETHLDDLVNALVMRGHSVFVLAYKPLVTKVTAKIYEENRRLKVLRIPWLPGLFYKLVKSPILEFGYLLPGLFVTLPFVLMFNRPDVIHTHGLIAGFAGVFWGKVFDLRIITTTHSIYHFLSEPDALRAGGLMKLYNRFARWILNSSDAVLTLSKQSKKEIVKLGVPGKKVKVFTYWVDLNKFKPIDDAKKKLGFKDKFIVLFVGRLIPEKGINELLEAYRAWDRNITLMIAGTGPLEEMVKDQESTNKNFKYLGRIENDKLPLYYSAADLTIVPSTHEEGFGRVILESLACGTPVIGSNRGAIPEAMDKTVGKLIDVEPMKIVEVIESYYKKPQDLAKLSTTAAKYARKRYSHNNLKTILKSYEG